MKKTAQLSRRGFIGTNIAAGAGLLLRSLATGIPPALLLAPSRATAQGNGIRPQTLILSVSQAGDPVNINCPGSYINNAADRFQNNPVLPVTRARFGDQRIRTAEPWAALPAQLRRRLAFFHMKTFAAAHPEFDETMSLRNAVKNQTGNGSETFASMSAQLNATAVGSIQKEPIILGRNRITYENQPLQQTEPTQLKALFDPAAGTLDDLGLLRDRTLDRLYATMRNDGTRSQMAFLERFITGRDQARTMGNNLGRLLESIPTSPDEPNSVEDYIHSAVALAQLGVAPVIVLNIPFGRDNHQDSTLETEAVQTTRGINAMGLMWQELNRFEIQDQVTFAMLNVFGRKFNRNARGGRDHNRDHSVMVSFGRHINGGVYGGVDADGKCTNIAPDDGRSVSSGGISANAAMATAGRSLAAALGHSNRDINTRIQGGRILNAFINRS